MITTDRHLRRCLGIGVLLICLVAVGCSESSRAPRQRGLEPVVVTQVSGDSELFVEFRPLISGEPSVFAAHFTRVSDYQPVTEGTMEVLLSGGGQPSERFRIGAPRAPGIFAPTVVPRAAGERQLQLILDAGGHQAVHDLGTHRVYASVDEARQSPPVQQAQGEIGFLKEQQWNTDFAVESVQPHTLRDSISGRGRIRAAAEGEYLLHAPSAGLFQSTEAVPVLGMSVDAGQVLGSLLPQLATGTDRAALEAELRSAQAAAELAGRELARLKELFAIEAVARRRVEQAEAEQQIAQARLQAARQRVQRTPSGAGIPLRTPIAGVLEEVRVTRGAAVREGELLFRVVSRDSLWLEVQVAESDAGKLATPSGASFVLPGTDQLIAITPPENGQLIGVGRVIDPQSRSLPVIFALNDPPPSLAINQVVAAQIYTGQTRQALSVPASALIDDAGQRVVYVMSGGESFSRVPVSVGVRDGDRFEVSSGLNAGDRVVSQGAIQIRLAAATPEAMGHGHAH